MQMHFCSVKLLFFAEMNMMFFSEPQDNDTLGRERCRNAELNSMKYETDLFFDAYLEEK